MKLSEIIRDWKIKAVALTGLVAGIAGISYIGSEARITKTYEYNHSGNSSDGVYGIYIAAQTFNARENFTLKGVSLYLKREGNPSSSLNVAVFDTNNSGSPENKLAESRIDNEIDEEAWYNIPLLDYNLSKGKTYAIVLSSEAGDKENKYWWGISNSNDYNNGIRLIFSSSTHGTWEIDSGRDYKFEVYGNKKTSKSKEKKKIEKEKIDKDVI